MANPASSSSSSSSAYEWTHDVFLSFRGEDTRFSFTRNLYHALCEKGVNTFLDDQGLSKGEQITPALMKAIQESRIAIVIFSQNYASSTFCLQELEKIMECIKQKGKLVWPIFYEVDPSDVRHQKGSYGEALAKHETRFSDKDKVKNWRLALKEAADLSGWHSNQRCQYDTIGDIVQEVSKRINRPPLYVANHPVGLQSRVHKVKPLLDVESNDGVRMVGIYGTGGIGKTTLACAVYNSIANQFKSLCFLADIRENSMKHGLVHLQETLLSHIIGEKDIKLGSVKKGIPIIKTRLCKKKILLILDDVDKLEQLKVLVGGLDWFGSGSRIIITTRDRHLLRSHGVDRTYEVEGLNDREALELFNWNALKRKQDYPSYQDIARRVIQYSNGLPLSLEIIGSDLVDRTVRQCESALDVYESIPHEDIQKVLRVSYDGLKEFEKKIFLDMACFFKGYQLSDVINLLYSGRGLPPDNAIQVLIDKCLIKIVSSHVRMHNLIENMGKDIVHQESPEKPGKRSRLWDPEDILHVLKKNKGSGKIEIILLHLPKEKEVQWDGSALKKMEILKILVVKNVRFSRGPSALPESLKVLKWSGYPESSLPADFDPNKLVLLDLSQSFFTFKNPLNMNFNSLMEMKLSDSKLLKEVPDMSGAPNLRELYLDNCKSLVAVHDSVGFLDKLRYLILNDCTSLRVLPHGMNCTSLEEMSLWNCTSLKSFPEISGKMENLRELHLKGCKLLREVPDMSGAPNLMWLDLDNCKSLVEVHDSVGFLDKLEYLYLDGCTSLGVLPRSMNCTSLVIMSLQDCASLESFPEILGKMEKLWNLDLSGCELLREVPDISGAPNLECLELNNCTKLVEVHDSVGFLNELVYLNLNNCTSLRVLPRGMNCTSLGSMSLENCASLESFPEISGKMENLRKLDLSGCELLRKLPDMSGAPNLEMLYLDNCKSLVEVHDSVGFLDKLKHLYLNDCTSLGVLPLGMNCTSLERMSLQDCASLESFPEFSGKMEKLRKLDLSGCELLREVPDMSGAPNLEWLYLRNCKSLVEVHDSVGFLDKLEYLYLDGCTSLRVLPRRMNCTSLVIMSLRNCASLESFPEISRKMEKLAKLDLRGCELLREVPDMSLRVLYLDNCKSLVEVHDSVGNLAELEHLYLDDCTSLGVLPRGMYFTSKYVPSKLRKSREFSRNFREDGKDMGS